MKHRNVSLFVPHLGCPHTCVFCNQRTISGSCGSLSDEEIISACDTAIKKEASVQDSEIAFFGGSFTAIDRNLMIHYLETVQPYIGTYFSGIRISTRPDAIDNEILDILKRYNVTSVELGAQSMDDKILALNERGHKAADTYNASKLIREYGFSLGLQMMTGLYGSSKKTDLYTAECFAGINPDTVRIYPTVVLEGTALAGLYKEGLYKPSSLNETVDLCADLLEYFHLKNITVIRCGLHSGGNVEKGFIAGVYHPAFGELCYSAIYKKHISAELENEVPGRYTIIVPTGEISKACGQNKANKNYFTGKGYYLSFSESENLAPFSVRLEK